MAILILGPSERLRVDGRARLNPAGRYGNNARMSKSRWSRAVGIAAVIFVLAGACRINATATAPVSNVSQLRLSETELRVTTADGQPYTGRLVAVGEEIVPLAQRVFRRSPSVAFTHLDPRGLILVLPIEDGIPEGRASLQADLRSPEFSDELERLDLLELAVADLTTPTVEVAYATFVGGQLEGAAALLGPGEGNPLPLQPVAVANFEHSALQGIAREFYPGGQQTRRELSFVAGTRRGAQRTFYPSGELEQHFTFDHRGAADGIGVEYYANGTRRRQSQFEHGRRTGRTLEWYPTGQLRADILHRRDGPTVRQWYSNGKLRATAGPQGEVDYPADGLITEYYPSGATRSQARYAHGVQHGKFTIFYSDGERWEEGRFDQGKRVGRHAKWWKNGKPALEATYTDGELDGDYTRWYASGQTWEEATYVAGKREGRYQKWWKNGAIAHDYRYQDGKLEGEVLTFYDSGARWAVGMFVAGKPQGTLQRWFPDGRLGYILHHENGRPNGAYQRWYADGTPRLEAKYVKGKLDGEFRNWLEDGSVYEFATYERGKKLTTTLEKHEPG